MKKRIVQLILIIFSALTIFNNGYSQSYQEKANKITEVLKEELALSDDQYESVHELLNAYFKNDVDSELRDESLIKSLNEILNPNQIKIYNRISLKLHYMFKKEDGSGSINYHFSDNNDTADSYSISNEPSSGTPYNYIEIPRDNRSERKNVYKNANDYYEYPDPELVRIENEGGIIPAGND